MAEIRFDAVLNDQMSEPLLAIATILSGLSDAINVTAKDFAGGFDLMTQKVVSFSDVLPEMTTQLNTVAESVANFTDSSASNYIQSMKAMNDATVSFFSRTEEDVSALTTESTIVGTLADSFSKLADNKDLAAISEEDLKNASTATSASLTAEASASASASASITAEADAGTANQADRESGYGAIMGAVALLGMAGAALKVGENMLASGIQSQAALTMVTSLADQNAAHVGTYEQGLQQIAIDTGTQLTSLAGGLYDIASVGFQGADALKILGQAAKAAAVGGTDLHDVTNGLTSIMIAFGMNADQSAGALNTLIIGVRDGKAHFADFSRAIGLVSDTAKNSGFSFDESAAALAAMSAVYPTVRQAGQNLRSVMQDLGVKMDSVAKTAKGMGLSFDEQKFSSMGLYDRLMYLKEITGGNQAEMLKLLGGVQGLNAYFAITADGGSRFTTALHDMQTQTGTLDQAFAMYKQSMQAHMEELGAATSVLSANFALLAQPLVLGALKALTDAIVWLSNAFEKHGKIVTAVLIALAGVIVGMLIGGIVALADAMSGMILPALAIAGPFIAIGAALGILVAWFIAAYQHSQPFRDALHQLGMALQSMWSALQPLIDSFKTMVENALRPLVDILFGTKEGVGANHDALTKLKGPVDFITQGIHGLTQLVQQFTSWLHSLHQKVVEITEPTNIFGRSLGGVRTFMHGLTAPIKEVQTAVSGVAEQFDNGQRAAQRIHQGMRPLQPTVHSVGLALQNILTPLKVAGDTAHTTAQHAETLWDKIKKLLEPLLAIGASLLGVGGAFGLFHGNVVKTKEVVGAFENILKGAWNGFKGLSDIIFNITKGALDGFIKYVIDGRDFVADLIHHIDGFWGTVEKVISVVKNFGSSLMESIGKEFLKRLLTLILNFDEIVSAITGAIQAMAVFSFVALIIAGIIAGTVMQFKHWYDTSEQFRKMLSGFAGDLGDIWKMLVAQINPVFKQLSEVWKTEILPLGAQLMLLWKTIQPALMLVGAIVIAVLVVAFGFLVNAIKGVIASIGPFISGLINIIAGLIRVATGIVQLFIGIIGGIMTLLYDAIFNTGKFNSDFINIWNNIKNGVVNIVVGLWDIIKGLWEATLGTLITFAVTFVTGIISWFAHLFDTLVGHSIVTDLVNRIYALFTFIFVTIPNMAMQFVLNLIAKFQYLVDVGLAFFVNLSIQIPATFIQMVTNVLNAALYLENEIFVYLNMMVIRAIQFFVQLQTEAPILINAMVGVLVSIVMSLRDQAINILTNLVSGAVNVLKGLVSLLPTPVQDAINAIFNLLSGALSNATNWGATFMKNLANGLSGAIGAVKSVIGNVVNAIAGPLAHFSPAKEGPLAGDDKWMPNMMMMMQHGIESGTPGVRGAATRAAQAIKEGVTSTSGALSVNGPGNGTSGLAGGARPSGAGNGQVTVTMNIQGGLGAGLQLMNPSDRQAFVKQISQELGNQLNMQGRVTNGYSGF